MNASSLAASDAAPRVSVIIPSYNSARTIAACLDALVGQSTAIPFEVIVADSSDDETPALVETYVRRHAPRIRSVRSEARLFPGPARNLGIRHARADILAFTDADCVVAPDWVEQVHRLHARHDAVGGRILNGTPRSLCGTALYMVEFAEFGGGPARRVASIPSCNISYKRAVIEKYGPFPEVSWGEEYILNSRITDKILYAPEMTVRHVNRTGFRETLRHARKVGHGCALSRRATRQLGLLFAFRPLIPLLCPYRFVMAAGRSARGASLAAFLRASPMVLLDMVAWTAGFWEGAAPPDR